MSDSCRAIDDVSSLREGCSDSRHLIEVQQIMASGESNHLLYRLIAALSMDGSSLQITRPFFAPSPEG